MTVSRHTLIVVVPMLIGAALLGVTLYHTDFGSIGSLAAQIGFALPLIFLPGAVWHVLRTVAWRRSFPSEARPSFGRLFRVRLAAEAVSFVTVRGVAGEPLKVALLGRDVRPAVAAAAVALERIVYVLTTAGIVVVAASVAMAILPLTRTWMRIFAGVAAFGAGLVALSLALLLRRPSTGPSSAPAGRSAVARFLSELDQQLRHAAREHPRRLLELVTLEVAAYVMMALEAWVVFRLIDVPITPIGALAVETLTRVASMVSAFIPANLGALEASNVAAAAAVQAAGGAAALAVARRVRGLLWCAGGFLIYPRRVASGRQAPQDAIVILEDSGLDPDVPASELLGGMPIAERLLRGALRAGYSDVLVWTPRQQQTWAAIARHADLPLRVTAIGDVTAWQRELAGLQPRNAVTVLAPGVVPSPRLLVAARELIPTLQQPFAEASAGIAWPHSGVFRADIQELAAPADVTRRLKPEIDGDEPSVADLAEGRAHLALSVATRSDLLSAERRLRQSIFKPTDGLFGSFNRRMSIPISIGLIRSMRLSAHAMSVVLLVAGFYAGWLFSRGDYISGIVAALVSWAASVLDGCDGELARLQYKDSAFGCWLDTLGDYAYYFSIFTGLTIGVARTHWAGFWWIGGSLFVGLVLTFGLLILLRGRITSGHPERLRTATNAHFYGAGKRWMSSVAKLSTVATRATMPYGLLAFAAVNMLPAFVALAAIGAHVYWISLALQLKSLLNSRPRTLVGESSEPAY